MSAFPSVRFICASAAGAALLALSGCYYPYYGDPYAGYPSAPAGAVQQQQPVAQAAPAPAPYDGQYADAAGYPAAPPPVAAAYSSYPAVYPAYGYPAYGYGWGVPVSLGIGFGFGGHWGGGGHGWGGHGRR